MPPLPSLLRAPTAFPFAGRGRELAMLDALLPRAVGEAGRAALVAGEPGSGKSRLVRELATALADEGAIVLYGSCDAVVKSPYGVFTEALGPLARGPGAASLRASLGPYAADLARLLPDFARSDALPFEVAEAEGERHRLHVAVAELLGAVGETAPVLVVVEDIHWADVSTLLLLRHLVRAAAAARVLVLATYRDVETDVPAVLAETLAELTRSEGVVRLRLAGLDDGEVSEFLGLAAGAEPDLEVTEEIAALTDGNAFLLTELWRELVDSDAIEIDGGRLRLARALDVETPAAVRDVVAQRVARLEPATGQVLELGAVAGSAFELDVVRRAAGLDEGTLLDAVDEAVRSGIVVEAPGYGLAFRFAHELVRRSVVDRVSARRRAELHLLVGQALESTSAGVGRPRLAALAHHYAEAAPLGEHERAVAANLRAAEWASESLAFDEAVGHLRTALRLGVEDVARRGVVELELGYACHRAGRSLEALDAFRGAAAAAREMGDVELLARAAIGFEEACWRPAIHDEGAVELLEEAVAAVPAAPSESRVRLLGALTRALDFKGDYPRARPVRDEATAMARALGDRAALGWVLSSAYWSRGSRPDDEIKAMLAEAYAIGDELDDDGIRAEALWWLVPSYVTLCDHAAAREALDRLFELAAQLGEPFRLHVAEHYASALALCEGDLDTAEAAARRSHEWSRLLRGRDPSGVYGIQMFGVRREQGRLAELAPAVRVVAAREGVGAWPAALVVLLADLGMHAEAAHELERIRGAGLGAVGRSLWLATLAYVTEAAVAVGFGELAEELYDALEPHAGSTVQIGHLVACLGSADRHLGMLAGALGDWERAEKHFEDARALNSRVGATTWLAHTLVEHARVLLARRSGDDSERAAALLREASSLADRHRLVAVRNHVVALGGAGAAARSLPDGLSPREVEILGLVALGLSNREIGSRLHISEHTAANHVRSILRKTGCANRTEAATYAHRRGLVGA